MMVHTLVSIFVILSFSDNVYVYSCKRGPSVSISPKIRTNIRTGINKAPLLKERSWYKRNLGGSSVKPPRGNRNGHGVYLGGYYADNLRMRIMFAQGAPRKISKFHKIDIDELAASRAVRDLIKKYSQFINLITSVIFTCLKYIPNLPMVVRCSDFHVATI